MTRHLLYLHGFRSSPKSFKAQRVAAWVAEHRSDVVWACPQLPPSPAEAMALIGEITRDWPHEGMAVIGSSLGGFYATALAEQRGCRAVLINPAVEPARDLQKYIGEISAWHSDERLFFRPEYIGQLEALTVRRPSRPERYLAIIAKGDEVLDWHEMSARYAGCRLRLLEGGDHALSDFDTHLPELLAFLQLS